MSRLARVLVGVAFLGVLWPLSILSAEAPEIRDIESRGYTVNRWQSGPMVC